MVHLLKCWINLAKVVGSIPTNCRLLHYVLNHILIQWVIFLYLITYDMALGPFKPYLTQHATLNKTRHIQVKSHAMSRS
jgi:hypothetical protein